MHGELGHSVITEVKLHEQGAVISCPEEGKCEWRILDMFKIIILIQINIKHCSVYINNKQ